tara:strand:- start:140 stop:952 length:813 start_codon:yes stop_codon:yes gene_type:complete
MITYGYFRHRFDAHENSKLNLLVDEIGVEAYAYYYTILEIYGSRYCKNTAEKDITIHMRILANVWRKRIDSCHRILTKLHVSGLLVVTKSPLSSNLVVTNKISTCTISIPNYSKYYGSYKKKESENVVIKLNKSKVNKKVKAPVKKATKDNVETDKQTSENELIKEIIDLTNNILCKKFKHTSKESRGVILARLEESYTIKDFEHVVRVKHQEWANNADMKKYLQPSTLFGNKFDKYLNQELIKTQEDIEAEMIQKLGGLTYETREPEIQ